MTSPKGTIGRRLVKKMNKLERREGLRAGPAGGWVGCLQADSRFIITSYTLECGMDIPSGRMKAVKKHPETLFFIHELRAFSSYPHTVFCP